LKAIPEIEEFDSSGVTIVRFEVYNNSKTPARVNLKIRDTPEANYYYPITTITVELPAYETRDITRLLVKNPEQPLGELQFEWNVEPA